MKTIWEVLMIITFVGLCVLGITTLGEKVFVTQTLDADSVNLLSTYSAQVSAYQLEYNTTLNKSLVDPYKETDLNEVDGFVQEYRDYKGKLDQLKDGLLLIYQVPDLILYVVPFVEPNDLGLYADAYRFLVWILLMLLIIVGLKNGQVIR